MADKYNSAHTGQQIDDAVRKAHKTGATDPTTGTAGVLGQRCFNTASGHTFVCIAASGGVYTWADATGTGKNLLHNWDFRNPVNQRGQTNYVADAYTIDRWKVFLVPLTVNDGYIALPTDGYLLQFMEADKMKLLLGKTITVSLEKSDGSIISGSCTLPTSLPASFTEYAAYNQGGISLMITLGGSGGQSDYFQLFRLHNTTGSDLNITRVKAELGSISTLANDPPADYGEQLALCQRYFEIINAITNINIPATMFYGELNACKYNIPFKVTKRVVPTISFLDGTIGRFVNQLAISPLTGHLVNVCTTSSVGIQSYFTATATAASGWVDSLGRIAINADL